MNTIALSDIPLLWRAQSLAPILSNLVPTGFSSLDAALGGGWPRPSLIELLCDEHGIGELRLLIGLLKAGQHTGAEHSHERKVVLWLSPPFELHAIALSQYGFVPADHWICTVSQAADLQWAMTHALRSGACEVVIAWARTLKPATLRTLKLAALTGRTVGVLFRPADQAHVASPATVRLGLKPKAQALEITVLKVRGRRPGVVCIAPGEADVSWSSAR